MDTSANRSPDGGRTISISVLKSGSTPSSGWELGILYRMEDGAEEAGPTAPGEA